MIDNAAYTDLRRLHGVTSYMLAKLEEHARGGGLKSDADRLWGGQEVDTLSVISKLGPLLLRVMAQAEKMMGQEEVAQEEDPLLTESESNVIEAFDGQRQD